MKDLKDLLVEATESGPRQGVDLQHVLESGRRRVRRRRVAGVAGAGAAVAIVTAGSLMFANVGSGDRVTPADSVEPVGPVTVLADAEPAAEDREYAVLSTVTNENLNRDNGVYYRAVTADGKVVVEEGPYLKTGEFRAGLLDPRTGDVEPVLEMKAESPDRFVGSSDRWLVWQSSPGEFRSVPGFLVVDRETHERSTIDIEAVTGPGTDESGMGGPRRAVVADDGRIYFALERDGLTFDLWSVSPEAPADLRREGVVGDFDVDGDLLTYTEHTNQPSSAVHVRDLRSGEESTFDARSGSRCNALGLDRAGDLIALHQYCGEKNGVRDDRMQIVDAAGEPVVTLRGNGLESGALTSRYATVMGYHGKVAGVYVYDLESGELWRVSEGAVAFGASLTGKDDLLTWATPVNQARGMKLWAVDFGG